MANKTLKTLRRRRIDDIYYLFMSVLLYFLPNLNVSYIDMHGFFFLFSHDFFTFVKLKQQD